MFLVILLFLVVFCNLNVVFELAFTSFADQSVFAIPLYNYDMTEDCMIIKDFLSFEISLGNVANNNGTKSASPKQEISNNRSLSHSCFVNELEICVR